VEVAVAVGVGVQDSAVFVPANDVSVSRAAAVSAAEVKTASGLGYVVGWPTQPLTVTMEREIKIINKASHHIFFS
jgi:hypothetical protein